MGIQINAQLGGCEYSDALNGYIFAKKMNIKNEFLFFDQSHGAASKESDEPNGLSTSLALQADSQRSQVL